MKSYFARLAARAAPPREPEVVVRERMEGRDPFELVAAPEATVAAPGPALGTTTPTVAGSLSRPASADARALGAVEPESPSGLSGQGELSHPKVLASPTPKQPNHSLELPQQQDSGPTDTARFRQRVHQVGTRETTPPSPKMIHAVATPAAHLMSHMPRPVETPKPSDPEEGDSYKDLADAQHEQTKLLRKADTFMNGLLAQRARAQPARDQAEDNNSGQREAVRPISHRAEGVRLKPPHATEPASERDSERPTLVIGKLTVEVTQPPPVTVMPRARVALVHNTPRGAGDRLPSPSRFGLGQI